jgi:hypothetical protein
MIIPLLSYTPLQNFIVQKTIAQQIQQKLPPTNLCPPGFMLGPNGICQIPCPPGYSLGFEWHM